MADTIDITAGAGTTIVTDEAGAGHYQVVKLADGTADATAVIAADVGVKANALRVAPANDITDGTYIGDIKFGEAEPNSADILTALQIIDDWDDGDLCNVNLNIAGTDVSANAGVLTAQTLRVTIATDDECNNFLGTIDADTGAMLTALQIMDDWDDANYCNVNLNVAGTDVAGGAGVLSAQTLRVTIATDDECNNFLGTIDADTSNMATALQIIDDWDATHASAAPTDGVCIMGTGYSTGLPTDIGADADAARICTDRYGRVVRGLMPQWFNAVYNSADASGEGEVVKAKTASRKIYILSLTISVDAEMWVEMQDEDSNAITPKFWLKAGGGLTKTYPPEAPLVLNVANKDLEVITEGAGNIGVEVTGYLAP